MSLRSVARAVWCQDWKLAKILLKHSLYAQRFLRVDNGVIALSDPVEFSQTYVNQQRRARNAAHARAVVEREEVDNLDAPLGSLPSGVLANGGDIAEPWASGPPLARRSPYRRYAWQGLWLPPHMQWRRLTLGPGSRSSRSLPQSTPPQARPSWSVC